MSLTACKNEANINKPQPLNSDTLEGTVDIWISASEEGLVEAYISKFKEEHSKVIINNTYIKDDELEAKLRGVLEYPENKPEIIVLSEDSIHTARKYYSAFGEVSDSLDTSKSKILKDKNFYVSVGNKVVAVPWYIKPRAMFYRRDLFQEIGINAENIKTWKDYMEAGKKLSEQTAGKVKLMPLDITKDHSFFRQLVNQLGGSYYDKENRVQFFSQPAIKSMTTIKGLYDGAMCYNAATTDEIIAAAQNNELATIPYGTDIISQFREKLKEQSGKWGIMNMPAFEPGGGIASINSMVYIAASKEASENKAATEFKGFLQKNKTIEKDYIVNKGVFPLSSELYDESFMDEEEAYFNNQKIWRYLAEIIKEAPEFSIGDNFYKINTEVIKAQNNIVIQKQDISATLQNITKDFNSKNKVSEIK
jgi:lactose/L-arabinose transport system substrate-binding protein